jgi:LysM repeat protein
MSYTVRSGDSLSAIASRHNVSLAELERANPQIRNPNLIDVGEKINLPGQKDGFDRSKKTAHKSSAPKSAVAKLNSDLSKMNKASSGEKKATASEKKADAAEKTSLDAIAQQRQSIEDQITQGTVAPAQQQALLKQMVKLGQQQVQVQDKHTQQVSADKKTLASDKKAYNANRKAALKDLKPAEEKLSLSATNKDRKELGLKSLKKAVRPAAPQIKNVVGGQVGSWIAQAQAVLKAHGIPLSKMNAKDIAIIIQHESSGNPKAINNWDSNAAAGHPSEGLMQTIGPTFNSYKLPGHGSILNPVDNIIAGVRYAISRYGSISNVPGVRDVHAGRAYVGY